MSTNVTPGLGERPAGNDPEMTQLILIVGQRGGWALHRVLPGPVNDGTDRPSHETNASLMTSVTVRR